MMNFTVFYRELDAEQIKQVNTNRWRSPVGVAYLEAEDGNYSSALDMGIIKKVALVNYSDASNNFERNLERIFQDMQNEPISWRLKGSVQSLGVSLRSMMVGDVIYDKEHDTFYHVDMIGFTPIIDPDVIMKFKNLV